MAEEIILKLGLNVGFCFVVGVSYSICNLCKTFHLIWTGFFFFLKRCALYMRNYQQTSVHQLKIMISTDLASGIGVTSLYVSLSYPHVHRAILPDT